MPDASVACVAAVRRPSRALMTSTSDFRSVDGLLRFVESGAIDLLGLDSSVARSNAMFRGALVAAKLLEVGDLAQRIANLEAVLKYRSPEPSSPFDDDLPKIDLPSEPSQK